MRRVADFSMLEKLIAHLLKEIARISGRTRRAPCRPSYPFISPCKNNETGSTLVKSDYPPDKHHLQLSIFSLARLARPGGSNILVDFLISPSLARLLARSTFSAIPVPCYRDIRAPGDSDRPCRTKKEAEEEADLISQRQLDARSRTWLS